uniref:Uncharacterized protein n=1 Tax=Lepeophtheirus salmonis TaxID=72036 RepID=A0A0K2SVC5_LEPSM
MGRGMNLLLLPITLRVKILAGNLVYKTWGTSVLSVANYLSFWMFWDELNPFFIVQDVVKDGLDLPELPFIRSGTCVYFLPLVNICS